LSAPTVLIVDDEKNILLTLALALEKLPLTVEAADTVVWHDPARKGRKGKP
jgi:hypothetical protein